MLQLKQTNQRLDIYSLNQHWVYGFTKDIHQLLHYLSAHDQRILGVFEQTFYIRETTIPEFLKHLELYRYKNVNPYLADRVIIDGMQSLYNEYKQLTKEGFVDALDDHFDWFTLIDLYYEEREDGLIYPR